MSYDATSSGKHRGMATLLALEAVAKARGLGTMAGVQIEQAIPVVTTVDQASQILASLPKPVKCKIKLQADEEASSAKGWIVRVEAAVRTEELWNDAFRQRSTEGLRKRYGMGATIDLHGVTGQVRLSLEDFLAWRDEYSIDEPYQYQILDANLGSRVRGVSALVTFSCPP